MGRFNVNIVIRSSKWLAKCLQKLFTRVRFFIRQANETWRIEYIIIDTRTTSRSMWKNRDAI